jgi:hypothetical protein
MADRMVSKTDKVMVDKWVYWLVDFWVAVWDYLWVKELVYMLAACMVEQMVGL